VKKTKQKPIVSDNMICYDGLYTLHANYFMCIWKQEKGNEILLWTLKGLCIYRGTRTPIVVYAFNGDGISFHGNLDLYFEISL